MTREDQEYTSIYREQSSSAHLYRGLKLTLITYQEYPFEKNLTVSWKKSRGSKQPMTFKIIF